MKPKVYVDGANVIHVDRKNICSLRLETAYNELTKYGFDPHIILPNYLLNKVDNPEIVKKMRHKGQLSLISKGGDEAVITIAYDTNKFIATNDMFKDHKKKEWWSSEVDKWFETKQISFDFIENKFSIPLNVRHRLNIQLEDLPTSPMTVPDFKKHATNGGISSKIPIEALPEPVQKIQELISQNPSEITLAALGSHLKNATGCKLKDLFGNAKHATRFLESRGYSIRHDKVNTYVKRVAA